MKKSLPEDIKQECVAICKGYGRRRRELSRMLAVLPLGIPTSQQEQDNAELKRLMAVRHALDNYDLGTGRVLLLSITQREPYERLCLPMGRQQFYALRKAFILTVAHYMGY